MKVFTTILKIVAALAAIAGIIYVVATYGDKIVAWAKKLLGTYCPCCCGEVVEQEAAEEEATEEEATEEVVEATAEEAPAQEGEVQADPADFAE